MYFTYVCPVQKKVTRKMQYGQEAHLELDRLENSQGPSLNHKYQLIAYAMLLEDTYNKPVRYGFIYTNNEKAIPVEVTPNARVYVKETLEKIRLLVSKELIPNKAGEKGKCVDCEYRNFCGDVR